MTMSLLDLAIGAVARISRSLVGAEAGRSGVIEAFGDALAEGFLRRNRRIGTLRQFVHLRDGRHLDLRRRWRRRQRRIVNRAAGRNDLRDGALRAKRKDDNAAIYQGPLHAVYVVVERRRRKRILFLFAGNRRPISGRASWLLIDH